MAEDVDAVIRSEFPRQRGNRSYLDSDSATLMPDSALRALHSYYERGALSYADLSDALRVEKERLAALLGIKRSDSILLCTSVQDAISRVASALSKTRRRSITISAFEHEDLVKPWLREMRQRSINIRVVVPKEDCSFSADSFASAIDEDTAAVLVSHIADLFGAKLPIDAISKAAKESGAPLVVDLTRSCFRVDVSSVLEVADVAVFPSHNALGPFGLAVCVLGDRMRESLESLPKEERPPAHSYEVRLLPALGSMNAGLGVLRRIGFDAVRRVELELMKVLFERTSNSEDIAIHGPKDPNARVGLVCFNIRGLAPEEVGLALEVGAEAVTFCGDLGMPWARQALKGFDGSANRLSLYVYNTEEEVKMVSEAIFELKELRMGEAT